MRFRISKNQDGTVRTIIVSGAMDEESGWDLLQVAQIMLAMERCRELVNNSIGLITALVPFLGYELCASVAKQAAATGTSVREVLLEGKHITEKELDKLMKPENMLRPTLFDGKKSTPPKK